jgi:hypothetical protein
VHRNVKMSIRQAYGLLDLFGDIGGFIDSLYYFSAFFFAPFWSFRYNSFLLTRLFRERRDIEESLDDQQPQGLIKLK